MSLAILFDWMKDRWSWNRFVICLLCFCPGYLLSGVQYFQQLDSRLGHLSRERKGNVLIARPGSEPESRSLEMSVMVNVIKWHGSQAPVVRTLNQVHWHYILSENVWANICGVSEIVSRTTWFNTLCTRIMSSNPVQIEVMCGCGWTCRWARLVFLPRNMTWRFVCQRKDKWYHVTHHGHHW